MKTHITRSTRVLLIFFAAAALLIFVKSKLDERNYAGLDNSFTEMYNDRLMVESYIYRLNELVYKKKIALLNNALRAGENKTVAEIGKLNVKIDQLIAAYAVTKLTTAEKTQFENFQKLLANTRIREKNTLASADPNMISSLLPLYDEANLQLRVLSDIQLAQGRYLAAETHSTVASSLLAIRLEWALYVLILAILFALYKKRELTPARWPTHYLN